MAIIGGIPQFQTYPCGNPVVFVVFCEALVLEWEPPSDNGGADLVAYRLWLRPVFQENVLRSFVFLCDSFILMYPCQVLVMTIIISSWRAIYFCFFAAVFFWGFWFYAFLLLIFCCSAFLLLWFSASLLFCFSVFPASLLLYFCAFLLLLFYFFLLLCFCCATSCSFASLLPVFIVSLFFIFFCFILFCLHPKWNPRETLGETQRNPKEIMIRNLDKNSW